MIRLNPIFALNNLIENLIYMCWLLDEEITVIAYKKEIILEKFEVCRDLNRFNLCNLALVKQYLYEQNTGDSIILVSLSHLLR